MAHYWHRSKPSWLRSVPQVAPLAFLLLVLPPHHLGDPDRRERRRTVWGSWVVLEDLQALTDVNSAGAVLGVRDPDLGQAVVHGPLQPIRCVLHLRLDDVE